MEGGAGAPVRVLLADDHAMFRQGLADNSSVEIILEVLFEGNHVRRPLRTASLKRE